MKHAFNYCIAILAITFLSIGQVWGVGTAIASLNFNGPTSLPSGYTYSSSNSPSIATTDSKSCVLLGSSGGSAPTFSATNSSAPTGGSRWMAFQPNVDCTVTFKVRTSSNSSRTLYLLDKDHNTTSNYVSSFAFPSRNTWYETWSVDLTAGTWYAIMANGSNCFINSMQFVSNALPVIPDDPTGTYHTYTVDNSSIFPNPERGFIEQLEAHINTGSANRYCVKGNEWYFEQTSTNTPNERLVLVLYYLDNFKSSNLPTEIINAFDEDMQVLRNYGFKCILRYAYCQTDNVDATKAQVLAHINQLKNKWAANKDVIYCFQAGFIGQWGEWYYTSHFTDGTSNMTSDRREIVDALLAALPSDVYIQLRTPFQKTQYLSDATPISSSNAFNGSTKSRLGHHNDAYLNGATNSGTYSSVSDTTTQKPYVATETLYVPIGGETNIESSSAASTYATREKTIAESSRLHYTFLKGGDWPSQVMTPWHSDGTYDELNRKLGYRYQLLNASYTNTANVGGTMHVHMNIKNVGFAPLYNERHAHIILTNASNTYSIQMTTDPRRWSPNGVITEIIEDLALPAGIVPGTYNIYLSLPDNHGSLASDPKYAVRFANTGIWDSTHGWNNLNATITVSAGSTPTLSVSPSSVNFGDKTISTTHTNTITVNGSNLSANATVSSNNAQLTVSPSTITPAQASSGQTVTLSLTPTATGSGSATVTIASSGATTKTVTVTWNGVAPASPTLTVSPSSVNFGDKTISTTHTNTITVNGSNLSANATVSSNNAQLTVSPSTITPAQASSGQTVTLSLTPTATGSGSATVTIASSGATTKTVTVTWNGVTSAPSVVDIPGTVNKGNRSAVSADTWWTTDNDYFDYGSTHGSGSRWIEWTVNILAAGKYTVTEDFYSTYTTFWLGHQWKLDLLDGGTPVSSFTTTAVWEEHGPRTEGTKWDLSGITPGVYTLRVTNPLDGAQPKLKSLTLDYDGEIIPTIPVVPADPSGTSRTYTADNTTIFPNPERGFLTMVEGHLSTSDKYAVNTTSHKSYIDTHVAADNLSLILVEYYLENYKTSNTIPSDVLNAFDEDMAVLRSKGLKAIVRFAYTDSDEGDIGHDAALSYVQKHIAQYKQHWQDNADVIFVFQMGIVGSWGEWYYTEHFGNQSSHMNANRIALVDTMMKATPQDRCVQIRTPLFKTEYLASKGLSTAPISYSEAYNGSIKSRIGHHNDAFLYNADNMGTYSDTSVQKPYISRETFYVPIGGESDITDSDQADEQASPEATIAEMSYLHWTFIQSGYSTVVTNKWRANGTFDELNRRLGYRYQLVNGTYTNSSTVGGKMKVYMNIRNVGFAPLYNKRYAYIILTNASNTYSIKMDTDPRRWRPNGVVTEIGEELDLPDGIVPGTYNLYLSLPDYYGSLASDPRYSIRFANTGIWDSTHGWNNLNATITVSAGSTPTLSVSPTAVNFGDKTISTTHTNTITVTGTSLSANATVSSNNAQLTVSPATITPAQALAGQTVTLSLTPTATGSGSATVTIASSGATTKTVTVTWNGVAAPSVVDLPGTVNKGNVSTYSGDMTWSGASNEYFDYGTGDAPNLDRWAEWNVRLNTSGEYTVAVEVSFPAAPDGYQWQLQLLDGGDNVISTYESAQEWGEYEKTYTEKWNLTSVPTGVYRLRVKNMYSYAQPKLKSLTLSMPVVSTYTVSYNAGSGAGITGSHANDTKTHDVALTLPGVVFSRTGYTQTGWSTSNGGAQTHALGGSYTTNADQTFYPVWTANNYNLTWNLGGGTTTSAGTGIASGVSSNTTSSVAYGTSLTAPTVTKTGYNFNVWSPSVASTMPATATTYTATWTVKTTTITINANTANHGSTTPGTVTATWGSVLPSFAAASGESGYTLRGYYTAPTDGTKVINVDGTLVRNTAYATDESTPKWKYESSSLTLYAQYDAPTYVVFDNNNGTGNHNWSVAANWQGGALPTALQTARIIEPCIVNITTAVAKNVLIATGSYNGHLTIAPTGGLVVTEKIQKAVNGNYASPTAITASDLTIQSSSTGQGALVLGTEDGTAQATVQMYSKAYIDTHKHWQYMGIPYSNTPEAQSLFTGGYMYRWDETTAAGWNTVSNTTALQPFVGYCLSQPAAKTYEWTGTLCASSNRNLTVSYSAQAGANLFANSWTAPIEIANFENGDFSNAGIDKVIYIFNTGSRAEYDAIGGEANTGSSPGQFFAIPVHAAPYAAGLPTVIPPMQGFQIMTTVAGTLTLDYARLTAPYGAGLNTQPLKAPKSEERPDVLRLTVYGQSGQSSSDRFYLLTRSDCSENYDNGWDGKKMLANDLVALYSVSAGGDMAVDTRSQMAGTNLTFVAGVDSAYTMEFYYTGSQTLYLFDQEANTYTQLTDGATYTFDAVPYATSMRFHIVAEKGSTTDLEGSGEWKVESEKFIQNGHLYLRRNGLLFDATGKRQ